MLSDRIFGLDLPSILESLYLNLPITELPRDYTISINPEKVSYVIRKTIIINDHNYPLEHLKILLDNGCRIISRIKLDLDLNYEYSPYLFRYCPRILWNGEFGDSWSYNNRILYAAKPPLENIWRGSLGETDYLGFIAHQVGVNIYPGPYQDLDLVKTKKGRW